MGDFERGSRLTGDVFLGKTGCSLDGRFTGEDWLARGRGLGWRSIEEGWQGMGRGLGRRLTWEGWNG